MEHNDGDAIRLTVPATSAAVRIARVGAAGLGTRLGFTFTEVEELRLAVGEAAALLCDEGTDATLIVVYDIEPHGLRVTLSLVAGEGMPRAPHLSDMAAAVLDTVVDAWEVEHGGTQVVLHKAPADHHDHDD